MRYAIPVLVLVLVAGCGEEPKPTQPQPTVRILSKEEAEEAKPTKATETKPEEIPVFDGTKLGLEYEKYLGKTVVLIDKATEPWTRTQRNMAPDAWVGFIRCQGKGPSEPWIEKGDKVRVIGKVGREPKSGLWVPVLTEARFDIVK